MEIELMVYVVELEQPFENWTGVLKSVDYDANTCVVEDNDNEVHTVRLSEVTELETNLPLLDYFKQKKDTLVKDIAEFLNGKRDKYRNVDSIFYELNVIVLGEDKAILTDDILERYANEEYFNMELLID